MFSENGKISARQLYCLIVVESMGTLMLLLPDVAGEHEAGLMALAFGFFITLLHTFFVLWLIRFMEGKPLGIILKIAGVISIIKCVALSTVLLLNVWNVVHDVLLPRKSSALLMAVWIAAALCIASMGIEARGRLGEAAHYLVVVPLMILILMCIWHLGKEGSVTYSPLISGGILKEHWLTVIGRGFFYSVCLAPVELLFWNRQAFSHDGKTGRKIVGGIVFLGVVSLIFTAAAIGILGVEGISSTKHSLMAVAGCLQVAGAVVMQKQGLVLLFFLLSMLTASGSLIYHVIHVTEEVFGISLEEKNMASFPLSVWRKSFFCVGVIVWVLAMLWSEFFPENKKTETESLAATAEIEDRAYCISIAVDEAGKNWLFTLELAGKEGENSEIVSYVGKNLSEVAEKFDDDTDKELDISHIQVLLLGNDLKESGRYIELVEQFGSSALHFGSTLLAFTKESGSEYLKSYVEEEGAGGIAIRKRFEQGMKDEKSVLSSVYFHWVNHKDKIKEITKEIPEL